MYRKLVFVLTMFAVAFGSLSQVQAALASPHPAARVASAAHAGTPASIAMHSATGAARAATAGRQMAHGARLLTEERQGSPPLSTGRRATGTASAPTITSAASLAAPKITNARASINGGCQIFAIPGSGTFTVGQSKTVPIFTGPVGLMGPNDIRLPCTLSDGGATLPSGVTFTDSGYNYATLSGTPAAGTVGTYPLTITAANGGRSISTLYFTLTVNQAPGITSPAGTTFTAGQAGTFTVTSTGVPNAALSETGALPSGVTFTDNGDGTATLAGTPAPGSSGPYPFTITATNGVSPDATQAFTLTVNHAPKITSRRGTAFTVGQAGTFTVTSTGVPTATLSEKGTLPTGVTFTDNGDGTATLAGTPTTGGPYPFTITATNGVSPDATQNFTLTVNAAACQITSSKGTTFTVGQAATYTVKTTGYPLCQLSETGALPPGVTFTDNRDGTGTLSGTPAAGSAVPYPFTITATNGVNPAGTQAFILTVNQVPGITSPAGTTFTTGQTGTFTVTTSGVPNSTLSETGALPTGVTFTDNKNGTATLAGIPGASSGGTYPFTITATNGVNPAATQPFVLTVNQACQITSDDHATFDVGQAGTITVATTGWPTCALSETGKLPSGVTFTDNGDGTATLAGTPAPGTGGTYLLTITATNAAGSDTQTFTLTVLQAPGITSPGHATCTVGMACAFTVRSTGVPTPSLSESGNLPSGVLFTDNGDGRAALSGIPTAGTGGTYRFRITATNGAGSDTQHFTLTVVGLPAAPSGLKATIRGRTVSLTWTNNASAPSAATAVQIQRSTNARFTTAVTNTVVGPAVTSHRDTVVAGKRYYYRVRAHNAVGFSSWSNVASS